MKRSLAAITIGGLLALAGQLSAAQPGYNKFSARTFVYNQTGNPLC